MVEEFLLNPISTTTVEIAEKEITGIKTEEIDIQVNKKLKN